MAKMAVKLKKKPDDRRIGFSGEELLLQLQLLLVMD